MMTLDISDLQFDSFTYNARRETLTSIDKSESYLLKVQIKKNPRKLRDIDGEFNVMRRLNDLECVTCPTVYALGSLTREYLTSRGVDVPVEDQEFRYTIQEYIDSEDRYTLSDIIFSMIEQKKLGVYQGDIKPDNVRFSSSKGVCVLIDYDQSIDLTQEQMHMSNRDFLSFCDENDRVRYGFGDWLRHFPNYSKDTTVSLFEGDSLDLSRTSIFKIQKTTNTSSGFYHTVETSDVFIHGSRGMKERAVILDKINFARGERVLDVGCNAGLLCEYLNDRGCQSFGIDNDPYIVVAAKMLANIAGRKIGYKSVDLDFAESIDQFDTVMLFSVFHHTRNPDQNAKKIANSCRRIIIETRLTESGKQPINGNWIDTTRWSFENLGQLVNFLESIFTGFKYTQNIGAADKGRYVIELVKQ